MAARAGATKAAALKRLRAVCKDLPETSDSASGRADEHVSFFVREKKFAYLLDNHHGDGRLALTCKAAPGAQDVLVRGDPARFFVPPYVGAKGWVGARLDVERVDWETVADLLRDSYRMTAPKRLAAQVGGD